MSAHVSQFIPDDSRDQLYAYDDHYEVMRGHSLIDDISANDSEGITLPYLYQARAYQVPVWDAFFPDIKLNPLAEAVKRIVLVWHRRAGKDKTCVNLLISKMVERKGYYLYLLPKQTQARKVIWKGIGKEQKDPKTGEIIPGVKFLDHFPEALIANVNNTEMTVEFINGSICQLGGSDSYDAMMGTNPIGIVFSEYSLQNPMAWDYFRPILAENDGWAIFEYTPRGKNHGYHMNEQAKTLAKKDGSGWFQQLLTVTDTKAIPLAAVEAESDAGMSDEMIQQEFYCSFDAYNKGSIFGKQIQLAWKEKRIKHVPVTPGIPVSTFWDIGVSKGSANKNTIWFAQLVDGQARVVHYYENDDEGLPHYLAYINAWAKERDVSFGLHWAPHDIQVREWTSKKKRIDTAKAAGITFKQVPNIPKADGIEAAKAFISRCSFDETQCKTGITCLTDYSYKYDEETKVFSLEPIHNWAAGGSDSFRMMAVAWKDELMKPIPKAPIMGAQATPTNDWSPFG